MAVNKVVQSNGTTLIDISDTTAAPEDVAEGKIFYLADGTRAVGTRAVSDESRTIIVPEQTITASSTYTVISSYAEALVLGEQYVYTINGIEYTAYAVDLYGSVVIRSSNSPGFFEYDRGLYFTVYDSAYYGTYTVKVEKIIS